MASKVFYVVGIIAFYLVLSVFLSYADLEYTDVAGFDVDDETTPDINESQTSITLLGFFSILIGIFAFNIAWIPFWLNLILYLPLLMMIVLIYELIRGV